MTDTLSTAAKAPTVPNKPVGEGLDHIARLAFSAADLIVRAQCYGVEPLLRAEAEASRAMAVRQMREALALLEPVQ